jgi:hypothetical protein
MSAKNELKKYVSTARRSKDLSETYSIVTKAKPAAAPPKIPLKIMG